MIQTTGSAVQIIGKEVSEFSTLDDRIFVPLKTLCAYLGIDYDRQRSKVKNNEALMAELVMVPGADGRLRKTLCLPWKAIGDWVATIDPKTLKPEIVEAITDLLDELEEGQEDNHKGGATADSETGKFATKESKKEHVYNWLGNLNWFLDAFLLGVSEIADNDGDYFPGGEIIKASPEEVREYVRTVRFNIRVLQAIIDASIEYENMENPLEEHELIDFYNESLKLYRTTNDLIHGFDGSQNVPKEPDHSYLDYLCGPALDAMAEFGGEIMMGFHEKIIPRKEEGHWKTELLQTIADRLFKGADTNKRADNIR